MMQTIVCIMCDHLKMTKHEQQPISIALYPTQIDAIVRAAARSRAPSVSTLIGGYMPPHTGEPRGILELARDLDLSPSTAHRYAITLVELGLLERCPKTRKYRLPGT